MEILETLKNEVIRHTAFGNGPTDTGLDIDDIKAAISTIEQLQQQLGEANKEIERLRDALEFYADPTTYHATSIMFDPPCGEFQEDFDEDYVCYDFDYGRPMPGKRARQALNSDKEPV